MSSDDDLELSDIEKLIYKNFSLKCQRCKRFPRPGKHRWYNCSNAFVRHYYCQDCKDFPYFLLDDCLYVPNCGTPIMWKTYCPIIEGLLKLDHLRFKCANEDRGCQKILDTGVLNEHEKKCIYRQVTCPFKNCASKVPFHALLEHMEKTGHFRVQYKFTYVANVLHEDNLENLDYGKKGKNPVKIEFDDRAFLFQTVRSATNIEFWIQLLGTEIEAKNYYYKLEFHGNDPNNRNTYSAQVMSIDATNKDKYYHGIDYDTFRAQFVDEKRVFKITISLKNAKEEAKDDIVESGISDDE